MWVSAIVYLSTYPSCPFTQIDSNVFVFKTDCPPVQRHGQNDSVDTFCLIF